MDKTGTQPFRWCFIGTGTLARRVAKEITASGRHVISSIYSRRYENAVRFAGEYGGTAYDAADAAINDADAVYVVTPHPAHYPYVRQAVEQAKPVLCEKPFTVRASETRELFSLAREKGVYIVEGMWTWFAPAALAVREWLERGLAGEVLEVETKYLVNVLNYAPRLTDPDLAGGALLDSGVYPVTYLYRLFGKPVGVRCTGKISGGVDLSDEIDLEFQSGLRCHIALSICDDARREYIRIRGTKADIFADRFHCAESAVLTARDGSVILRSEGPTTMLNEFDLTAREIREGKKESEYIPPRATEDVMDILDECRRQIGLVYPFEK